MVVSIGVATAEPTSRSLLWISTSWERMPGMCREEDLARSLARPRVELSSSTSPRAAKMSSSLESRSPLYRADVPLSPVLVYIFMAINVDDLIVLV